MNMELMLKELMERGFCDEGTAIALRDAEGFVKQQVKRISAEKESLDTETAGRTLLFLEELIQEPGRVQAAVADWLEEDKKRRILFEQSSQSDIYGELLVARAKGKLDDYKAAYNPNLPLQQSWTFDELLTVTPGNGIAPELLGKKVEAVLETIKKGNKYQEFVSEVENWMQESPPLIADLLARRTETRYRLKKCLNQEEIGWIERGYDLADQLRGMGCENALLEMDWTESAQDLRSSYEEMQVELKNLKALHDQEMNKVREYCRVDRDCLAKLKEALYTLQVVKCDEEVYAEIDSIRGELFDLEQRESRLSEKIKRGIPLMYRLEISSKDPLDVRFGNDAGCCIGIYDSGYIGNADGIPHIVADNAIIMLDVVNQQRGKKERRVGLVYAFDAVDAEKRRVLVCNSLELSPSMNPSSAIEEVVSWAERGIKRFAEMHGFSRALMSDHQYNTSKNYSRRVGNASRLEFKKIRAKIERSFYADIDDGSKFYEL